MIISEEEIILSEYQNGLLISGWGKNVYENTLLKKIYYESSGVKVQGYLSYPTYPNQTDKKYPLIIWNRGGNRDEGRIDDFIARGIFGEIASWGYVVLASNYREEDEFGGADIEDVLNLIGISRDFEFCDAEIIGMEGWSRGGMMTYLALSRTDKIKCAVIISGMSDLFRSEQQKNDLAEVYARLFGIEDENEFIQRKKQRSAVLFAEKINKKTNILLIHGTADKKISYLDSVDMHEKLLEQGINCKLELIDGGDHYLKKFRALTSDLRKSWFETYLK